MKIKTEKYKIFLGINIFCLIGILVMGIAKETKGVVMYSICFLISTLITLDIRKKGKSHILTKNIEHYSNNIVTLKNQDKEITVKINADVDPIYKEVISYIIENGRNNVSIALLQRRFKIGYNRASQLYDSLEKDGIIGNQNDSILREVLIDRVEYVEKEAKKEQFIKEIELNATLNNEEVLRDSLKKFNIEPNYKNDGKNLKKIKNALLIKKNETEINYFIKKLIQFNSPKTLRLAFIDDKIDFIEYTGLPHLKFPIVKDLKETQYILLEINKEIENRYKRLSDFACKNIYEYNKKYIEYAQPDLYIIINELYDVLKDNILREQIKEIVMTEGKVGIKIISFSKFNKKHLNLGLLEDLFKFYDKYEIDNIFNLNIKKEDISFIDNNMDGFDFEKYTKKLLLANDFDRITITQKSNDFGADVIAYKDNVKYAIQCKKYATPVGITAVQEIIGSRVMNDCHVAVVLTNNIFTSSAKKLANKNKVLLWDRTKLKKMMDVLEETK